MPGIDVTYRVTPNRDGQYPIVCAELCGLGHSVMRSTRGRGERGGLQRAGSRSSAAPAAPPAGGGGGGGEADGKAIFTSEQATASPATRWPTREPTARSGRTWTRCSPTRTRPSSASRSSIPNKEIADGYQADIMPPNYGETLAAGPDRCAGEVPFGSDQGGLMTARLRAPGLSRAFLSSPRHVSARRSSSSASGTTCSGRGRESDHRRRRRVIGLLQRACTLACCRWTAGRIDSRRRRRTRSCCCRC